LVHTHNYDKKYHSHPKNRRPKQESYILEIEFLINDIITTIDSLDEWTKPTKPEKGFVNMMDDVLIYPDPLGVVLVMGAWNYPLQLPLVPFGAAIAAGNVAILKPSEISVNCMNFIAEKIPKYLDNVSMGFNDLWVMGQSKVSSLMTPQKPPPRNAITSSAVASMKRPSCSSTNSTTSSTRAQVVSAELFTRLRPST
jgi:hypothetical protein